MRERRRKTKKAGKIGSAYFEYHHFVFKPLLAGREQEYNELREEPTRTILFSFFTIVGFKRVRTGFEAIHLVKLLQERLEKAIAELVETKSVYYWLHVYRRFAPGSNFSKDDSATTIALYTDMTECAFLKYGRYEIGEELIWSEDGVPINRFEIASGIYAKNCEEFGIDITGETTGQIFLGKFGFNDLITMFRIERLVYEYWWTTACLRRLYKGGMLIIDDDLTYRVENDLDTERLITSYDSRARAFEDIATPMGVLIGNIGEESKNLEIIPRYNVYLVKAIDYPFQTIFGLPKPQSEDFIPNFLWVPFDFGQYYIQHQFCEKQFLKMFGLSLISFVQFLYLICFQAHFVAKMSGDFRGLGFMQRAYIHNNSKESFISSLMESLQYCDVPMKDLHPVNSTDILNWLDKLSIQKMNREDAISLTTRGPRPLIIHTIEAGFIVDYGAILDILATQMHFIKESVEEKGTLFEENLKKRFIKTGFALWECRKKLRHSDGTGHEIDISFSVKNILFICELKSITRSFAFEIGETAALEYRKERLKVALNQAEEKVHWLVQRRKGENYIVPIEVEAVVPVVITPFVEYIWSRNKYYWLTEDVPRICTPSELKKVMKEEILSEIVTKPYVKYMQKSSQQLDRLH